MIYIICLLIPYCGEEKTVNCIQKKGWWA